MSNNGHTNPPAQPLFWSKEATLLLIRLYKRYTSRFVGGLVRKKLIWQDIHKAICESGYEFTWEQCEGRWKTLTAAYRRAAMRNKSSLFHAELSEVIGHRSVAETASASTAISQPRFIAPKQSPVLQPQIYDAVNLHQTHQVQTMQGQTIVISAMDPMPIVQTIQAMPTALPSTSSSSTSPTNAALPGGRSSMKKRRKSLANGMVSNTAVLDLLREFEIRQEVQAAEFLEHIERMHNEKLTVIKELICVMKDVLSG